MNAPSEDIKDMLVDDLSLVFGTNLFIGEEPTTPDDTVTIFDTPGFAPDLTMQNDGNYHRPSVQIRVRNQDYRDGWSLTNDIKVSLHGRAQETWNGTLYSVLLAQSDPFFMGLDENRRARFVITFNMQRR